VLINDRHAHFHWTICFSTVAAPSNVAPISSSEHKGAPLNIATKQSSESYETPLTVHPKHNHSSVMIFYHFI